MKASFSTVLSCAFFLAVLAILAPVSASALSLFRNVEVANSGEGLSATLTFNKPLGYNDRPVSFFKNYIHVEFPEAVLKGAGKTISVENDEYIQEIMVVQYSPSLLRVRIVLKEDAEKFADRFQVAVNGATAQIAFDSPAIAKEEKVDVAPELLPSLHSGMVEDEPSAQADTAEALPARAQKVVDAKPAEGLAPAASTHKDDQKDEFITEPLKAAGEPLAEDKIEATGEDILSKRSALAFGAVMALIFALAFAFKKFGRRFSFDVKSKELGIKIIATQVLAPKSSLALVSIGSKNLLLGLTPEKISLISEVGNTGMAPDAGMLLQAALEGQKPTPAPRETRPAVTPSVGGSFNEQLKRNLFAQASKSQAATTYSGRERLQEIAKLSETIRDKVSMVGAR